MPIQIAHSHSYHTETDRHGRDTLIHTLTTKYTCSHHRCRRHRSWCILTYWAVMKSQHSFEHSIHQSSEIRGLLWLMCIKVTKSNSTKMTSALHMCIAPFDSLTIHYTIIPSQPYSFSHSPPCTNIHNSVQKFFSSVIVVNEFSVFIVLTVMKSFIASLFTLKI